MATLFTLPQHLRDTIAALADAHIVDADLQAKLDRTLEDADRVEFEPEAELAAEREIVAGAGIGGKKGAKGEKEKGEQGVNGVNGSRSGSGSGKGKENGMAKADTESSLNASKEPDGDQDTEKKEKERENDAGPDADADADPFPPVPVLRPATIDSEILDELAAWAGRNSDKISAAGLDAAAYGPIALLAGTTVYLPPRARALAKVAERTSDAPNPYLPRHLSPHPPSIGSEYKSMLSMLSTVLNVLFSIFGAGGAAYAAATGGGGWTRERGILLAVVVGIVVGIADLGLLWIYSRRKAEKAAREAEIRVRENRGSAKEEGSEVAVLDDAALEAAAEQALKELSGEVPSSVIPEPKKTTNIRLRRRAIDS